MFKLKSLSAFLLFFLLLCILSFPKPISAHVLKTNGNIGAVLHIDPDDDPIVGQQAGFFFEFKDKQGKFQPQNCTCIFSILEGEKEIFSQPLFASNPNPNLTSVSVFFTFPQKDVYQVKVVGKPNTPDAFQPFTLVYDIRVSKESASQPPTQNSSWFSTHTLHLAAGIIILIFVAIAFVKQKLEGR